MGDDDTEAPSDSSDATMSVSNYFDEVRIKELYTLSNSTLCNQLCTTATPSIFNHIFLVAVETVSSEYRNYFKMESGEVYCMSRINLGVLTLIVGCFCLKHQHCNDSIYPHLVQRSNQCDSKKKKFQSNT